MMMMKGNREVEISGALYYTAPLTIISLFLDPKLQELLLIVGKKKIYICL